MRIILDTNVFISGIFFSGPPSQILKAWGNQSLQIVLSKQILDEYKRVATELSTKYPQIDIAPIVEMVTIHGQFIDTKGLTYPYAKILMIINSSNVLSQENAISLQAVMRTY